MPAARISSIARSPSPLSRSTDRVAERHRGIEFVKAGYLGNHRLVLDTFVERIEELLESKAP